MGTHTHSQTRALGRQASPISIPSVSLEATGVILSLLNISVTSLCQQQATSASASRAHSESPTLEARIKEFPDDEASSIMSFHSPSCTVHTPITSFTNSGGSKASSDVKGKTSTTSSSTPKPDLTSKLDSDGKLTSDE